MTVWHEEDCFWERIPMFGEYRIYDGAGLESALLKAGFESVEIYGGLGGEPYDIDAKRLVAVAHKGEG